MDSAFHTPTGLSILEHTNEPIDALFNEVDSLWEDSNMSLPPFHTDTATSFLDNPDWDTWEAAPGAITVATHHALPGGSNHHYDLLGQTASMGQYPDIMDHDTAELSTLTPQTSNEHSVLLSERQHKPRATRKRRIENGYPCNFLGCADAYDTAGELSKHFYRKHSPESSWPFACDICGKRFYDRRDHGRHMKVERKRTNFSSTVVPDGVSQQVFAQDVTKPTGLVVSPSLQDKATELSQMALESPCRAAPVDFCQASRCHNSAEEAVAAAKLDLTRLINLCATRITIKAVLPSQEPVTLTVVHDIKAGKQKRPDTIRFNPAVETNPQSSVWSHTIISDDAMFDKPNGRETSVQQLTTRHHESQPHHSSSQASKAASETRLQTTLPRPDHKPATLHSPISGSLKVKAITVRVHNNRPNVQRSITHPGHVSQPPTPKHTPKHHDHRPPRTSVQEILFGLRFSGLRIHFDRHLQTSKGLAWARCTPQKIRPGMSLEL